MFIQVIQAKVSDAAGLRSTLDEWEQRLAPGAVGWLGTTAGITDDGTFIALARFSDADAAQANSERPEQGEWFAEVAKQFDGEPDFLDCDDVKEWMGGGSDDAGFVQIMRGRAERSEDASRMRDMMAQRGDNVRADRPEILGGLMLLADDGRWVNAIYFTSEKEAREGEAKPPPEEIRAEIEENMSALGDVTYFDLKDPILRSP
jgi:hypothetical protein